MYRQYRDSNEDLSTELYQDELLFILSISSVDDMRPALDDLYPRLSSEMHTLCEHIAHKHCMQSGLFGLTVLFSETFLYLTHPYLSAWVRNEDPEDVRERWERLTVAVYQWLT